MAKKITGLRRASTPIPSERRATYLVDIETEFGFSRDIVEVKIYSDDSDTLIKLLTELDNINAFDTKFIDNIINQAPILFSLFEPALWPKHHSGFYHNVRSYMAFYYDIIGQKYSVTPIYESQG